ncbi:hypothetical protein HER32_06650 [Hymenobacter sp. BT18]|uniref:DUF5675 family protein n=1 Tax=Hymenobacter sp. BT18 TaxID=2835648 RepID=UPI00143ECB53|nr:DUF5675 family protein [Hymenobacter sp. BT18]QIX60872.1 hypothetical protein HER32_06650 [Hymenobacter sp. BT18]
MSNLLSVRRAPSAADWTLSRLFVRDKDYCAGVEDEARAPGKEVYGETCVPLGIYPLGLRPSPNFSKYFWTKDGVNLISREEYLQLPSATKVHYKPHDLIWVKGPLEKRLILLHWGNTDDDTDGCYVVGEKHGQVYGQMGVLNSRRQYVKLYKEIIQAVRAGGQFIEYRNA